jgi:hypothetical protein
MNSELEALVRALDAVIQARGGQDAERLDAFIRPSWRKFYFALLDCLASG